MENEKQWYTSKLFWLGVIQVLIGALNLLSNLLAQATVTPSDVTLFVAGALTIVLRVFFTEQPISR